MNTLDYNFTGGSAKKFLGSIMKYKWSEIAEDSRSVYGDCKFKTPQYFMVKWKTYILLVDTQGYNYARYMCKVTHYPGM